MAPTSPSVKSILNAISTANQPLNPLGAAEQLS
jgi:hypothetical protein